MVLTKSWMEDPLATAGRAVVVTHILHSDAWLDSKGRPHRCTGEKRVQES